MRFVTMCSIG